MSILSNNWLIASRFICCIILHQQLNGEILEGQGKMKFALNHRHRFDSYKIAFFAGFMQTFSCLFIELINLFVIITSETVLEVVLNFMAIAIIAEFDNSFFQGYANEDVALLLSSEYEELFKITMTTSNRAKKERPEHSITEGPFADPTIKDKDGKTPDHLKYYYYKGDSLIGKVFRLIYAVLRVLHVSAWFYFFPYLVLLINYVLPLYISQLTLTVDSVEANIVDKDYLSVHNRNV